MEGEKKYFVGLNADDDANMLDEGDYVNAENIRWGTTDKGATRRLEHVGGTRTLSQSLKLAAGSICIGGAVERVGRYLVYFVYSPVRNSINFFDMRTQTPYLMINDTDVTGGLGFSKDSVIHSARIVNDILYWADGSNNEPRKLDIKAAVEMNNPGVFPEVTAYTHPLSQDVLYWIRKQPGLPVLVAKDTDAVYENNFIHKDAFQFAWRYIYRDYELSTLSGWSLLVNYNIVADTFNFIHVSAPLGEFIDQDVLQVDFVVKDLKSSKAFIFKSWNKNVPDDAAAIADHNDGTALSVDFYNDITGIALDDAYSVKPYDSLPIYAETIEMARNRAFIANFTIGYDTPGETSLSYTTVLGSNEGDITGTWWQVEYTDLSGPEPIPGQITYIFRVLNIGDDSGFYNIDYTPYGPPFPPTLDYDADPTIVYIGGNSDSVLNYFYNTSFWSVTTLTELTTETFILTDSPFTLAITGGVAFKTGASYQISISFLDHAGRKSGILTNSDLVVNIPDRAYEQLSFITGIQWVVSNVSALTEIPVWASYYSVNITKCLTTRYFLQVRVKNLTYVIKNSDGEWVFNAETYATIRNGIGVDITRLNAQGMGYVFKEGDLLKLYKGTDLYTLSIVDQVGNWLVCELVDIGTIGNTATPYTTALFQIHTPYRASTSEPHYEVSQIYKVNDPGTDLRTYSVLTEVIRGDITILSRNDGTNDYLTENMSPSDTFYQNWNTDAGRPNIIDTIGQQERSNSIAYSDTIIQRTKVNGLSTFEALNIQDISLEAGEIKKLQLANKIGEQGSIMLCICTRETASLYLGEIQILGSSANAFLAQSSGVIGTINILQGSYGTINPESVVFYKGHVYWYDMTNGVFVRYATNGIFPISNYKLKRVAKLLAEKFLETSSEQIETLGSRPFIFAGVDHTHGEILWAIPRLSTQVPKGTLIDYDSSYDSPQSSDSSESSDSADDEPTIASKYYPYDIWDQQAKTLVFKTEIEGTEFGNRWMGAFTFSPEWMLTDGNSLFSFENGVLFQHNNTDAYNNFYDIQYRSRIMFASNMNPSQMKSYKSLAIESNKAPLFAHLRSEEPYIQSSDLIITDFANREGFYYAGVYRDRLSPNVTGTYEEKMLTGDPIKTSALRVLLEFEADDGLQLSLRFVNILFNQSLGHKT
jgi:hypothetical protein